MESLQQLKNMFTNLCKDTGHGRTKESFQEFACDAAEGIIYGNMCRIRGIGHCLMSWMRSGGRICPRLSKGNKKKYDQFFKVIHLITIILGYGMKC